jgi:hypothetical protein
MKNLNISIISDVPPCSNYTAGQVLRKIINQLDNISFNFSWLNQSNLSLCESLPINCHLTFLENFGKNNFLVYLSSFFNKLPPIFKSYVLLYRSFFFGLILVEASIRLRSANKKTDLYWLVLQGENLIFIYFLLTFFNKKPFILHQWDPYSWWANHRKHPKWFYSINKYLLLSLEKKAYLNIVPSDAWKQKLINENKKAIRLDNFIDISTKFKLVQLKQPKIFNAVFIGQTYAIFELRKIVKILTQILNDEGLKLILHYYGPDSSLSEKLNCNVVNHGFNNHKNFYQTISKYDIALLPYPAFDNSETAQLSFPSKARVYLGSGLPILGFLPNFSSCHNFLLINYKWNYLNIFTSNLMSLHTFIIKAINLNYENKKINYLKSVKLVNKFFSSSSEMRDLLLYLDKIK